MRLRVDSTLLRRRPLTLAGLIVFAFAVALSVLTWRAEYSRQVSYLQTFASMGERSLDTFFVQLRSAMAFLGEEVVEHGEVDTSHAAHKRLAEFRQRFPALTVVALVRPDGQLMSASASVPGTALPSIATTEDFADTMEAFGSGQQFTITRPLLGRITKQWQISLRLAVRDAQGRLKFLVSAALPLTSAQGFWAGSPVPDGVILGVVRDDGYLLVRHPTPANVSIEAQYKERRAGALFAHLRENNFPKFGILDADSSSTGERNIVVFRRFENFPMTFRVSVPLARILSLLWNTILPIYALTLALLAALVAVYRWQIRVQRTLTEERERQFLALEAANRELVSANDQLDGFSYTVAHDLRAPVRALDGFAGLLEEDHGQQLGPEGRGLLARIRSATARMEALIDGMLSFARMSREALNLRTVDTAALVTSVAAEALPAEAAHELVIGPLPASLADPVMLRAVWSNLLDNAIKYSRHKEAPRIEVGYANGEFFVRDNGAGFDMAHAHNPFGAFQRLHAPAEFEGTGIGLAIVKRVVERHGGQVRAFGAVGQGAEFRFSIRESGPNAGALAQATLPVP